MYSTIYKTINQLFHMITLEELRLMNQNYSSANITYNSLLYLDLIQANPGKYTASMIADMLRVSKPAVVMKINELMKMGLIYKKQCPTDKRQYYLYVREEVLPEYEVYRQRTQAAAQMTAQAYSREEITKFCEMLQFIGNAYQTALQIPASEENHHV